MEENTKRTNVVVMCMRCVHPDMLHAQTWEANVLVDVFIVFVVFM